MCQRERDLDRGRRKVAVQLLLNEHMDARPAAAFGPFGDDRAKIAARPSQAEPRMIAD